MNAFDRICRLLIAFFLPPPAQTEEEIQTLRMVLLDKERYATDLRGQLGVGPLGNIKQNMSKGWHEVQTSAP